MRYPSDHKEKTRARILEAAGKVFRRQGYHAAGVDKVMEEAGLTAGGFYAHFESKQELLVEALARATAEVGPGQDGALDGHSGREWIDRFLAHYLGTRHRLTPEEGCPLVALVSEVGRADDSVKERFEAVIRGFAARLEANAQTGGSRPAGERALAALALCVGGVGLARSVHDEVLAERILESCRKEAAAVLCGGDAVEGGKQSRRRTATS